MCRIIFNIIPRPLRVKVNNGSLISPSGRPSLSALGSAAASPSLPALLHPSCKNTISQRTRQVHFYPGAIVLRFPFFFHLRLPRCAGGLRAAAAALMPRDRWQAGGRPFCSKDKWTAVAGFDTVVERGWKRTEEEEKRWLTCEEKKSMYMFSKITLNVPYLLVFCQFARLNLSRRQKSGWLRPQEGATGLWGRRTTKKNRQNRAEGQLTSSREQINLNFLVSIQARKFWHETNRPEAAARRIENPLSIHSRVRLLVRGDDERRRSVNNLELIQL